MDQLKLPIDLVAGTHPQRFVWSQTVDTLAGVNVVELEGMVSPSIEGALVELVGLAKKTLRENALLEGELQALKNRASATLPASVPAQPVTSKKGKG